MLPLIFFNLVLEQMFGKLNKVDGVTLGNTTIGLLTYSDNLAPLGNNLETVKNK